MPIKAKKSRKRKQKNHPAPKTKHKLKLPTLSLCMIVRDAANNLALCLDSVKNAVDEIIIVDTGSRDNTVAVARKYTDKVYHFKWRDDFARARNYSLKFATQDWILVMDDDEALARDSAKTIKRFLAQGAQNINGYSVWIYNCDRQAAENEIWKNKKHKGWEVHQHTRLLRNNAGLKFRGFLHEAPTGKNLVFYDADLKILHYGYSVYTSQRAERNLRIMRKQLQEKPDDVPTLYNYARSLVNYEDAITPAVLFYMDKTISNYVKGKTGVVFLTLAYIYKSFIIILLKKNNYAQAEKYCYQWLTRLQDKWDLFPYLYLGKTLFLQNKIDDASKILKIVYEKYNSKIPFCPREDIPGFERELYFYFGYASLLNFEYKLALKLLNKAGKYFDNDPALNKLLEIAETRLALPQ
ncbi:MAG: glycosyltransferase family 2 protein [Candidatus Margulisbacteria bacterium]|jgi:glycosyltransferase involved in cell wall biosynthesis|nr:glycosyltransferase family 2 protein [Candidatus Margulisiibacteriota bacterium]